MLIGVATVKRFKNLDDQYIGTDFFFLGLPIIPLKSYFFANNFLDNKISMGGDWRHITKTCLFSLFFGPAFFMGAEIAVGSRYAELDMPVEAKTVIFILLLGGIIGSIFLFRSSEEEKKMRRLYGDAIGINALPEFFNFNGANYVQKLLAARFKKLYGAKWNEVLTQNNYTVEQIPLLFGILGYQKRLVKDKKYEQWFEIIFHKYMAR